MKKKRPFTLLELLLVVTLMGIVCATCAIQIPKALHAEEFSQSVERFIDKVEIAQEIMIDYEADLSLHLEQRGDKVFCTFCAEGGVPEKLIRRLNKHSELKQIHSFAWEGVSSSSLKLPFHASSHGIEKGVLKLVGKRESSIFLPGYPKKIQKNLKEYAQKIIQAPYPQEVLSFD